MSKRKNRSWLAHLPQLAVSILILAIFAFPVYTTGKWIVGAAVGNDPRKTTSLPEFKQRPADSKAANQPLRPFKEPILTVTFDDGWETIYSAGMPIMQEYGIKTTQYILGDEFDNVAYLSVDQVRDMQAKGHHVASHSLTHPNLTELESNELFKEVVNSKQSLEGKFGTVEDFASPLGARNNRTLELIGRHYRSHRNTNADPQVVGPEDVNTAGNYKQYDIIAYTVRANTTDEELRNLVNYAIKNDAWVVLTYHQIDSSSSHYAVSPQKFEEQMQLIWGLSIRTQTMDGVLDAIKASREVEE